MRALNTSIHNISYDNCWRKHRQIELPDELKPDFIKSHVLWLLAYNIQSPCKTKKLISGAE